MSPSGNTIAVVTGANQGLGFATAKKLASDNGYHAIMAGRRQEAIWAAAEQLQKEGLHVEALVLDLGSDESIDAAVEQVQLRIRIRLCPRKYPLLSQAPMATRAYFYILPPHSLRF